MQAPSIYKIMSLVTSCLLMIGCVTTPLETTLEKIQVSYMSANKAYSDKNYELALLEYLKVSEKMDADAVVWFRIGNSYNWLESYDQAIKAYEKSLLLDPRLSKAWHNMGMLQLKQSVNSWQQMLLYISKSDPLYDKALGISKKLLEVTDAKNSSE
jgi:tetratricopeptide (TPR) repeat protein